MASSVAAAAKARATTVADDEELAQRTIFSFVIRQGTGALSLEDCRTLYRALARGAAVQRSADDPENAAKIAAKPCLIGQPVALGCDANIRPRRCASARARASSRKRGLPTKTRRAGICSANSAMSAPRLQSSSGCSPHADGSAIGRGFRMELEDGAATGLARYPSADRIGFARLTTMAFEGADLRPLRDELISKLAAGTAGAGEGLDLSLITQLLGDRQAGMAIQAEVLAFHQLYRSPCSSEKPKLRVLALAAAIDMGGNTPIEFLLENSGIELQTLYVVAGVELAGTAARARRRDRDRFRLRGMPRGAAQDRLRGLALAAAASQSAAPCPQSGSRQAAWPAVAVLKVLISRPLRA